MVPLLNNSTINVWKGLKYAPGLMVSVDTKNYKIVAPIEIYKVISCD